MINRIRYHMSYQPEISILVVYKRFTSRICGGSRGSDHCSCLTRRGPVQKSRDFFPQFFFRYFFPPHFFYRTYFPYFSSCIFSRILFPRTFFRYFFPRICFSRTSPHPPVLFFPYFFPRTMFPYFFKSRDV